MSNPVYIADNNDYMPDYYASSEVPSSVPDTAPAAVSENENILLLASAIFLAIVFIALVVFMILKMRKPNEPLDFENSEPDEPDEPIFSYEEDETESSLIRKNDERKKNKSKPEIKKEKPVKPNRMKPVDGRLKLNTPKTLGKCLRIFLERTKDI